MKRDFLGSATTLRFAVALGVLLIAADVSFAQLGQGPPTPEQMAQRRKEALAGGEKPETPKIPFPAEIEALLENTTKLNPQGTVFLDRPGQRLLMKTRVSMQDGVLEMLCCPIGTKGHESILTVDATSMTVKIGMLAAGFEPGTPVRFTPEFVAPTGDVVQMTVTWVDSKGTLHRRDAHEWIRTSVHRYYSLPLPAAPPGVDLPFEELRYDNFNKYIIWYGPMSTEQKERLLALWDDKDYQTAVRSFHKDSQSHQLTAPWVFTGSYFGETFDGEPFFAADGGDLICVANFASALIDLQEKSEADGGNMYEAWTERIPERDTPVLLELKKIGAEEETTKPEDVTAKSAE